MSFPPSPHPGYFTSPTGPYYQPWAQTMATVPQSPSQYQAVPQSTLYHTTPQSPQIYQPHTQQFFAQPNHFVNPPPGPSNTLAYAPSHPHPTQMGSPELSTHFPMSGRSPHYYMDAPLPTDIYGSEYSDPHPHSFENHVEDAHFVGHHYNPPLHPYDMTRSFTPPNLPVPSIRYMPPAPPVSPAPSAWFPGTPLIAPPVHDEEQLTWDTPLPNGIRLNMPAFVMVWSDDLHEFLYYWLTPCGYMLLPIHTRGEFPASMALLPMMHWLASHTPPMRYGSAIVFSNA